VRELRQLAQLGRQPFQLIVADLEHGLGLTHDLINSNVVLRAPRAESAGRFVQAAR
jgi:hypothetical protein